MEEIRLVHHGRELKAKEGQHIGELPSIYVNPATGTLDFLLIVDPLSRFTLDATRCPGYLIVANDALSVSIDNDGNSKWGSIMATQAFTRGRAFWKCHVTQCASGNAFVGVMTRDGKIGNYLGYDENSYGFYGCGNTYKNGSSHTYASGYRTGDIITCLLDMDKRTLSFKKNEEALGVAFEGLPSELFAAVSLYSNGDSIAIAEFGNW